MHYFTCKPTKHEFLVLEPEDWSEDEWKTILKLFGCDEAERIVIRDCVMQAYGTPGPNLWRLMLPDKCDFCTYDSRYKRHDKCQSCAKHSNFELKTRMGSRQAYEWDLYCQQVEVDINGLQ
jgi:hypothetical protein